MAELNYAQSGVDRKAADAFVDRIAILSKKTLNRRVKASIGGYASLFELDSKRWLAASTDGVGTKLKLAMALGDHRTVGVDLVAMSVNDLLCVGAEPLFFLDYFATGKLDPGVAEQVLVGIVEGCRQAQIALVGGETAEMPDFYAPGEYDLAGFAVGTLNPKQVLPRKTVKPGDVLIGVGSSGFHSNGFSLLRKLWAKEGSREARARELLTPTRIYVKALKRLLESKNAKHVKGIAHVTGSGFLNVPRISDKVSYEIELPSENQRPPCFEWERQLSGLSLSERAETFNLGVGLVIAVESRGASAILASIKKSGEKAWAIGQVVRRPRGKPCEIKISEPQSGSAVLVY